MSAHIRTKVRQKLWQDAHCKSQECIIKNPIYETKLQSRR